MAKRICRTYATDDLRVEVWVSYDDQRHLWYVNSKSPQHNPSENPTSFRNAQHAHCYAKETYECLSGIPHV